MAELCPLFFMHYLELFLGPFWGFIVGYLSAPINKRARKVVFRFLFEDSIIGILAYLVVDIALVIILLSPTMILHISCPTPHWYIYSFAVAGVIGIFASRVIEKT